MIKKDSEVSDFVSRNELWSSELRMLREICLQSGMKEEMKWELPAYTVNGKSVVVIQPFNKYIAILFVKGMLMKDQKKILQKVGANTRVGRQARFTNLKEIETKVKILADYLEEAKQIEESGIKIPKEKPMKLELPEELLNKFEEIPNLKDAWDKLTPGRQKMYIIHFSETKNPATREARIERNIDKILDGIGLNDYSK